MTNQVLARARAGDEDALRELTDPYRRELQIHIYRIVGSVHDAEDLLQETLLAARRGFERFEGRASVRAWLYQIATNRTLDALRATRRRPEDLQPMTERPEPTRYGEAIWLEPFPDVLLEGIPDRAPGPEARYETKEAIELGFIVGLQHLSPPQRAVLVLRDVLGYRAAETAAMLDGTVDAANNLLKRARATIAGHLPPGGRDRVPLPGSAREQQVTARFADAFERGDVHAIVTLLTDDAWLTMPPLPFEYQGRQAIGHFLESVSFRDRARRSRLVPTRANGQPAFARYIRDPHAPIAHAHGLIVLSLAGDRVSVINGFNDISTLARFGFPRTLPE